MIFDNKDKTDLQHFIIIVTPAEKSGKVKVCCLCGRRGGYMVRCERRRKSIYTSRHHHQAPAANSVTCKRDKLETRCYCKNESHSPKSNHFYFRNNTKPISIPSCKIQAQDSNRIIITSSHLIEYLTL